MKKIFYSLISGLVFTILLSSCSKFNDQFKGLDEMTKPTNVGSVDYTLTAADYANIKKAALAKATNSKDTAAANAIGSFLAFNSTFGAADYAPAILNKMFYAFDKNSSTQLTYNLDQNKPSYLNDLTTVNIMQNVDYQLAWGGGVYVASFTPTVSPSLKLPLVLAAKFPTATSGQYKLIEYNYSDQDASSQSTEVKYFSEDWTTHKANAASPYTIVSENGWISKDVIGKRDWQCRTYNGNNYAQATSNGSLEKNEVWMISPKIDLKTAIAPEFTFDFVIGYWNANCLSVWVSEDFDGNKDNIGSATWTDLSSNFTFPEMPVSGYSTYANAGIANLNAYAGKKVHVAFKYTGDGSSDPVRTTTYQIDNIKISEIKEALSVVSSVKQYVAYTFNGSGWVPADNTFFALQPADYTAMGLSFVTPANAPLYIPQLLSQHFPFAQEGTIKNAVYKSNSNVTYAGAMQFTMSSGTWVPNKFQVEKTEQFVYSNSGWVFDPTVKMTMVTSDYQIMVDYVLATPSISIFANPVYKNEEYYWGFASRYSNTSFRLSYRNPYFTGAQVQPATIDPELYALQTPEEKVALLQERLKGGMEIFAQLKYPNAIPTVSGIDVFYHLSTFLYYPNGVSVGSEYHEYVFQCTAAASGGNPPTFKYISDSKVN